MENKTHKVGQSVASINGEEIHKMTETRKFELICEAHGLFKIHGLDGFHQKVSELKVKKELLEMEKRTNARALNQANKVAKLMGF